jgi:hypothetical protein
MGYVGRPYFKKQQKLYESIGSSQAYLFKLSTYAFILQQQSSIAVTDCMAYKS